MGRALACDGVPVRGRRGLVACCGCPPYWPLSFLRHVEQLLELLTTEILHPDSQAPSGVKSHFLEIFLEELSKVGAAEVRPVGCGRRLSPPTVLTHKGLRQLPPLSL